MDHLVVVTDSDPALETGASDDPGVDDEEEPDDDEVANRPDDLRGLAGELGAEPRLTVAAATYTLEADLLGEPAIVPVLRQAYRNQHPGSKQWQQVETADDRAKALYQKLRKKKKFISKGEFAHDIALAIQDGQRFTVPAYPREAIASVVEEAGEPGAAAAAQ